MTEETHVQPVRPPAPPKLWPLVAAHGKLLALGAVIGIIVGVGVWFVKPKTYTSTATLLFPAAPPSRLAALAGNSGSDLPSIPLLEGALLVPQTGTSAKTAAVLLKSRRVQKDIVLRFQLDKKWKMGMTDAREHFAEQMICREGKDGELYVGFRDPDKQVALDVANEMVAQLGVLVEEMGYSSTEKNVEVLRKQAQAAEIDLMKTQQQLLAFQRKYRVIALPEQAKALAAQYATLQQDVMTSKIEAETAIRQVNMQAQAAGRLIEAAIDPTATTGAGATLSPLYQKVMNLESELVLLKQKLTEDHPDVQEKTDELKVAQSLLRAEMKRQMGVLKTGSSPVVNEAVLNATVSKAKFEGLQAALLEVSKAVEQLPKQQAIYARLTVELDANTERVKLFQEELQKADLIAQTRGPLYSELDEPELPSKRDASGGSMLVLFCMVLGLAVTGFVPYRRWLQALDAYDRGETATEQAA